MLWNFGFLWSNLVSEGLVKNDFNSFLKTSSKHLPWLLLFALLGHIDIDTMKHYLLGRGNVVVAVAHFRIKCSSNKWTGPDSIFFYFIYRDAVVFYGQTIIILKIVNNCITQSTSTSDCPPIRQFSLHISFIVSQIWTLLFLKTSHTIFFKN